MVDPCFAEPRLAEIYDALDPDRDDLLPYLEMAREFGAHRVLDIACGTGTLALILADARFEVTGLDPALASLDVARSKPGADRVRWLHGYSGDLPELSVDLVTMTGNAAQAVTEAADWEALLRDIGAALRPGGRFVFETRDPANRGWVSEWTRHASYEVTEIPQVGAVESWVEVTRVAGQLVSFRWTYVFASDGAVLTSDSTLRFRDRVEIVRDLETQGFTVEEVREAPDRPGRESVFVARKMASVTGP